MLTKVLCAMNGGVWPYDGGHTFENLMLTDSGGNLSHRASFVSARPSINSLEFNSDARINTRGLDYLNYVYL